MRDVSENSVATLDCNKGGSDVFLGMVCFYVTVITPRDPITERQRMSFRDVESAPKRNLRFTKSQFSVSQDP